MARKPTDKQLFKMKNEWLGQFYEEVKPKDFYRAVFPEGSFEREGHPEDEKCNGVLTVIEGEKARKCSHTSTRKQISIITGRFTPAGCIRPLLGP